MFHPLSLFSFSSYSSPFGKSCRAGLVDVCSFSLLLCGKLLISPSIFIESLSGRVVLVASLWFLITWNISCQSLVDWSVPIEKSDASLIRAPLYVTSCFFLDAFKILFVFNTWHFNYDMSWSRPLWIHLYWDPLCFLNLHGFFPLQVWKVFCHYFFKQGFYPFFLFFSFWYSCDSNIVVFHVILEFP